jgi:hypothetical protein
MAPGSRWQNLSRETVEGLNVQPERFIAAPRTNAAAIQK